jgi:hypothetical protein
LTIILNRERTVKTSKPLKYVPFSTRQGSLDLPSEKVSVFIIMLLPTVPDPDAVLAHLQPVCQSVWQALEVGVGAAHQYAVEEQPIGYALTAA